MRTHPKCTNELVKTKTTCSSKKKQAKTPVDFLFERVKPLPAVCGCSKIPVVRHKKVVFHRYNANKR
jgi:hypothetical protein